MTPDWDQHYQNGHTPWEKGAPAPPLLEWLEANPDTISGTLLVPGCGLGHDSRALARRTAAESIVGIDISQTAVEKAHSFEKIGPETYLVADLFNLPDEYNSAYDWVWEHTCFCAIDPELRGSYVDAVWNCLKPGGTLLAVFYLDPYDEDHGPGQGPPHGSTVYEIKSRFAHSGKFRIDDLYVPKRSYAGREGRETVARMTRLEA